ncbi:hypothetical protein [Spiroplasma endosymbiont of Nebria brevicollis]|uniref:hypothetical protein n=1 Tax=Spiroplasma endosymbiont of Nebria brevicollis TaxID=3066284 RepID=UPI00313BDA58
MASPRFPIFNYWWVIDQKYPKISKRKLKKVFIKFIKTCSFELRKIDNLNDKITIIHLLFKEKNIDKKYKKVIEKFNNPKL